MIGRDDAVRAIGSREFDLVVIGGGITGAGCALDASSRGLSVALLEASDYASGTSSRSSKLIHGGLRYLRRLDLRLVHEGLVERRLMVELAPHLVRPLPMIIAAVDGRRPEPLTGLGLGLYDLLAGASSRARSGGRWTPDRHRVVDEDEIVARAPALAGRGASSGYLFYDCQTDDSRLVLTVLGEAERHGAVAASRLQATGIVERGGWARGVQAVDRVSGEQIEIRARSVVNATGVWADRLGRTVPGTADVPRLRPSRGTHITFARERLPIDAGLVVPAAGGRTIFALPWLGATLVGTTDSSYDGDELERVRPPDADVGYLLDACNSFFGTELGSGDVAGAFAGLRPLIADGGRRSADASRKARLYESDNGVITITGGKLTIWRRMARQAIDRVVLRQDRRARCRTAEIALGRPVAADDLPPVEGVCEAARTALAARYGEAARDVLALVERDPDLASPILPGGPPDLLAEAVHAVLCEQALTVGDVLLRRTRLGLIAGRALLADPVAIGRLAGKMSGPLGWDDVRTGREAARFVRDADAEGVVPAP